VLYSFFLVGENDCFITPAIIEASRAPTTSSMNGKTVTGGHLNVSGL